jgi:lipopolysaccharide export LptBFGC system permease protein LptF
MKKSLFSTIVVALLAAVVLAAVSSTITVQADQKSADEKADSQADKDHIEQADNACQKDGYDGYFDKDTDGESDCDFLN